MVGTLSGDRNRLISKDFEVFLSDSRIGGRARNHSWQNLPENFGSLFAKTTSRIP
jgi:hypothetical protein